MNSLPNEILFEIFQHLEAVDLCATSAVCRAFDRVISDNSKLTQTMQLNFRKLYGSNPLLSRRYTKLKIGFFKAALHFDMLSDIGEHLASLHFKNCKLKLDVVRRILVLTPNVKKLKFDQFFLSDVPHVMKQPLPQLENLHLTCINTDPRVFRALQVCSIKELDLCQTADPFDEFSCLNEFLCSQPTLKGLRIAGFFETSLFGDDSLDSVPFKLRSVGLINSQFHRTVHLKNFLEGQTELEEIELVKILLCDFSNVLKTAHRLKRLKISNVSLNYLETLTSVEELTVTGQKLSQQALERFPSVKHLKLRSMRNKSLINSLSKTISGLESLEVVDGSVDGFSCPSVRDVVFCNVEHDSTAFFEEHTAIENLTIRLCSFANEDFMQTIANSLQHLTTLTLGGCGSINNRSLEALRKKCKKLRYLKIDSCGDDLDWKIFENRREIKVCIS